jgi:hypothetical protein
VWKEFVILACCDGIDQAKEAVEGWDLARLFTLVGQPTPETQTWILFLPPREFTDQHDNKYLTKKTFRLFLHGFCQVHRVVFGLLLAIDLIMTYTILTTNLLRR